MLQLQWVADAERGKARGEPTGDAPKIGQLEAGELGIDRLRRSEGEDAADGGILFRAADRDLRERLRGTDADRNRDAGPLQYRRAQVPDMVE